NEVARAGPGGEHPAERAGHEEFGMRHVHDAHHAEREREAVRHHGVRAADHEPVEDLLEEELHPSISLRGTRAGRLRWPSAPPTAPRRRAAPPRAGTRSERS